MLKNKLLFSVRGLLIFILLFFCLSTIPLFYVDAQPADIESEIYTTPSTIKSQVTQKIPQIKQTESSSQVPIVFSTREILLSFSVLSFGVLVIFLEFYLIKSVKDKIAPQDILLIFTITLILVGTLFLIASGHTSQQIAPVLGLFGTIIGYLLGRETEKLFDKKTREKNND